MQHDVSHIIHLLLYRYLNSRLLFYLYTLYFGRHARPRCWLQPRRNLPDAATPITVFQVRPSHVG